MAGEKSSSFSNKHRTIRQVTNCIVETVRLKIMGLRIRKSNRVFSTLHLWNISWELPLIQKNLNGLVLLGDI